MFAHYLNGAHIYQATASLLDSGTWKWICSLKNQALSNMIKIIGNGSTTSLLCDIWIPGHRLIALVSDTQLIPDTHTW